MKTLLIDDERNFLDGRESVVLRSSQDAIDHFTAEDGSISDVHYDEVWLDFSLLRSDSIMDFLFFAKKAANAGTPLSVDEFVIHTSSWSGASLIATVLDESGYKHRRFDPSYQVPTKIIGK
jgi:hypothetical protein